MIYLFFLRHQSLIVAFLDNRQVGFPLRLKAPKIHFMHFSLPAVFFRGFCNNFHKIFLSKFLYHRPSRLSLYPVCRLFPLTYKRTLRRLQQVVLTKISKKYLSKRKQKYNKVFPYKHCLTLSNSNWPYISIFPEFIRQIRLKQNSNSYNLNNIPQISLSLFNCNSTFAIKSSALLKGIISFAIFTV